MKGLRRFALPALALGLLSAWPAQAGRVRDDLELLARDVRELERLLSAERDRSAALEEELSRLRRLTGVDEPGRLSAADLGARLDGLDRDVQVLFENQGETQAKLSVLTDKLDALYRHRAGPAPALGAAWTAAPDAGAAWTAAPEAGGAVPSPGSDRLGPAPTGGLPPAPPVPAGAVEVQGSQLARDVLKPGSAPAPGGGLLMDPEELYRAARADYGRGDYPLAIEGFEEFVRRFPDSELTDNARYWIGESRWAQGEHRQALTAFESVLRLHPNADKAADAGLKRGLCLLELNRMADGILQLQHVKDAHPGTTAARLAREKLESLGLM